MDQLIDFRIKIKFSMEMFVLLYRWWLTIFDLELDEGLRGFNIGIFVRTREKILEKDVGGEIYWTVDPGKGTIICSKELEKW